MKKIIITTNFSQASRHTLEFILNMVRDTQEPCQLLLLNTYMVKQTDPSTVVRENDELKLASREGLQAEYEAAVKLVTNPLIRIETASYLGSVNNVLQQLFQKEKVDMVAAAEKSGKGIEMLTTVLKEHQVPLLTTYFRN